MVAGGVLPHTAVRELSTACPRWGAVDLETLLPAPSAVSVWLSALAPRTAVMRPFTARHPPATDCSGASVSGLCRSAQGERRHPHAPGVGAAGIRGVTSWWRDVPQRVRRAKTRLAAPGPRCRKVPLRVRRDSGGQAADHRPQVLNVTKLSMYCGIVHRSKSAARSGGVATGHAWATSCVTCGYSPNSRCSTGRRAVAVAARPAVDVRSANRSAATTTAEAGRTAGVRASPRARRNVREDQRPRGQLCEGQMLHAEAGMAEQSGLVLGVPEHLVRDRPRRHQRTGRGLVHGS